MNTYLLPIVANGVIQIISVNASSWEDAQDKFITKIVNHINEDDEIPLDWDELLSYVHAHNCDVGEIYDKDSF